jgi:hypothetical protein
MRKVLLGHVKVTFIPYRHLHLDFGSLFSVSLDF